MQVFLIEENSKPNFLKKYFKKIELNKDKIILNQKIQKLKLKKKIQISKKINKILKNQNSNKIIISKELKKDKEFVNLLYSNQIDITQGRTLFKTIINKVLENICKTNNIKEEEIKIGITINNVNDLWIKYIEDICKNFKVVNIVTNKINYFKNLQSKLYEENGVILTITNNKKKALCKCNIILNVDFAEETINKYVIYENSIIINIEEAVTIKKKRFNGKIINNYDIILKANSPISNELQKQEYENFDLKDLAEIYILNNPKEVENVNVRKSI